jgi:hypothetical protein
MCYVCAEGIAATAVVLTGWRYYHQRLATFLRAFFLNRRYFSARNKGAF